MRMFGTALLLVLCVAMTQSQTVVSGTINQDSTWTLAGSPYLVQSTVTVNSPFTLTADSGVVVLFASNQSLLIYGSLSASHVMFTSSKDTAGGSPAKGDWNGIQIGYSASGTAMLDHCTLKWGGSSSSEPMLDVYKGSATVTACDFLSSKYRAAGVRGGTTLHITGGSFSSSDWPLIYLGNGTITFDDVITFSGNTHQGIYVNYGGNAGSVTLDTAAVPYVFDNYTVAAGDTFWVASGNILKFAQNTGMTVNGALIAEAAEGQNIKFTSYKDDNAGGDTNGDLAATAPGNGDWSGVKFNVSALDSVSLMRRCIVNFGGYYQQGGVSMFNASPIIDSCSFNDCYYGVMMQGTSSPVFSNNVIATSQLVPVALSFSADPIFTNNSFSTSDNTYNAIGILSETVTANSYLPVRSFTSVPNVTYVMLGTVTIPASYELTIAPGVVLKSYNSSHRLIIQGKLSAVGTADSTIVFTSIHDDNYGNPHDTNKNGNTTNPNRGDWGGITFEQTSDSSSIIKYAVLRYGNTPGPYYGPYPDGAYTQGLITLINASPTIENDTLTDNVYGIYAFLVSNPKINNNAFVNSQYTPVAMSISANPQFTGNTMQNPGLTALGIIGHGVYSDGVLSRRDFAGISNITYVVLGDVTIKSGTNVTVDPGVVVKMNPNTSFFVNGSMSARGDVLHGKTVFTSIKDDNIGNPLDTNGDGLATAPSRGDWYTIRYQDTAVDSLCVLDSVDVRYGGGGGYGDVSFLNAGGTVSHAVLTHSNYYGTKCEGNSNPTFTTVTFQDSRLDPIAMSLLSDPTFTDITFDANGTSGIHILEGTLSTTTMLKQRSLAGITNIAYIVDNLTIASGAILTLQPGVVIKFPAYYNGITVQGGLVADGTASEHIVFTSLQDDSKGGDTNNDGSSTSPGKGNWNSVDFAASSIDSINSLKNCEFKYGGGYQYYTNSEFGLVRVYSSKVTVDSSVFTLSNTSGLGSIGSANPVVTNCEFTNLNYSPVTMSMFSAPTFSNNIFANVGYAALGIIPENYSQDATIPIRNFGGYTNITYKLWGNVTVNSGTVISIPAGLVFKDYGFIVNGSLKVLGASGQPVVFTDSRDDAYGNPGDTNGDGSATSPSINTTYRVYFADGSVDTADVVQYAVLRYANYGVDLQQAAPTVANCLFSKCDWGVRLQGVSGPTIGSSTFDNLSLAPVLMSLAADFDTSGTNVISGSTYRAIGIVNETLAADVTMAKRNFAGVNNIPYLISGLTVGTSSILTIEPGVILKFRQYAGMTIQKGILAIGSGHPDSTIVFTSENDDFYGGDTNADSSATTASSNYWGGITFADLSIDSQCKIEHAVVRFGGYYSGGALRMTNASPSIKYVSIRDNYKGVVASGASNPVLNYCDIYNNSSYGVENVDKSFNIDARYNWWGSDTGPTHSSNPGGTGSTITDSVNYAGALGSGAGNPLAGDVSLNGSIQAFDASMILKWLADSTTNPLNDLQKLVADVSANGSIMAYDASLVLQYVVGKIKIFPIEFNREIKGTATTPLLAKRASVTSIGLGNAQVNRGDQVTLTLNADGLNDVVSADIELSYDKSVLKPISVQAADLAAEASVQTKFGDGSIRAFVASANPLASNGALLSITFEALTDVRGKVDSKVSFAGLHLNETDVKAQATAGTVEVIGRPLSYSLEQNYPNPFNPSTTIAYQVPNDGVRVRLEIYNITGQLVRVLVDGEQAAGEYHVTWDGMDAAGARVSSGMYFYRLTSGDFVSVKKMMMLK